MPEKIKSSDYIIQFIHDRGVRHVFELSGGMITHLLDSMERLRTVIPVNMRHEQAAAFAADATGRLTGVPGVAMATSGPGAVNLLTGVGSCYFDSSPGVFITGQVTRNEQKGSRPIRQLGFQETDIVSMAAPITKASIAVQDACDLPSILDGAFDLAVAGRPGPVLLDVPMDVQRTEIDPPRGGRAFGERDGATEIDADALAAALRKSERPLILAGAGIWAGRAAGAFREFTGNSGLPVVYSLMGVDALPYGHPNRVGMIGTYGNRWANLALTQSDFLLVLGSRLDVRQTGSDTNRFRGEKTIFHVDCEPGEINNRVAGCVGIQCDIGQFLRAVLPGAAHIGADGKTRWDGWRRAIEQLRQLNPDSEELSAHVSGINPNVLMQQLSLVSACAGAYVVDVGQHQMWAAQSIRVGEEQRFLTSGGMGSMGFALPAGIGASFALSGRPIVVIAGDGGFQCNIQELQTLAHYGLPLKIVVLNNHCHGMVRQFQESYFEGRYPSTLWGYSAPDFAGVGRSFGVPSRNIAREDEISSAFEWLWESPEKPALLEVSIDTFANAYPKVKFGCGLDEMEP